MISRLIQRRCFGAWNPGTVQRMTRVPLLSDTLCKRYFSNGKDKKVNMSTKKQKPSIKHLRRSSPNLQRETAQYILSLLNKNNEPKSIEVLEKYLSPVTSVTVGETIDFEVVLNELNRLDSDGNRRNEYSVLMPEEVINVKYNGKDLMILSNGTIVGWGLSESVIVKQIMPTLLPAICDKCEPESEEIDWVELDYLTDNSPNNGNSYMQGDIMVIQGTNKDKILLDKAAFAIGLSRSTRLSVLENALENHIQLTRVNSEYLSEGKQIKTTESDVLKLTGRLFLLRGKLNLYSELIETPDLYWTEPTLERIYELISRNLDISPRISILNRKLDYATEEQSALLAVLNEKKSTRLEWIIIILIMVEVGFETFHFYERYSDKANNKNNDKPNE